jgi:ABC-type bacteriocin/lantibiotic exporter with double-glycine peptidase domain
MKVKCYKCWFKNDKDIYKCKKCWEIFRESEEKYKTFLKNKEIKDNEYIIKEPLEPDYKQSKRISRIPFFWLILASWKEKNIIYQEQIIIAVKWLILTLILLLIRKFIIKYAKNHDKWESFVTISIFISLILIFVIIYILSLI